MADTDDWLADRVRYIQGLRAPNEMQRLLVELHGRAHRSATDEKKLRALVRAERAAARMQKARADVARVLDADKRAARKARDRELYQCAGLMILAGLVDTTSGKPLTDKAELLGALMGLAQVPADDSRREEWRRVGTKRMAESGGSKRVTAAEKMGP